MSVVPATPDVLIVGGGVIGCAIARELAGGGRSVVLVERGALGSEASTAAAGVLSVASGDDVDGPRLALRQASLVRYPEIAAALRDETGIDVEYARTGVLELCLTPDEVAAAQAKAASRCAAGFAVEWWPAARLRAEEPAITPAALGALACLDDAQVQCARLVDAYATAARRRGALLLPGVECTQVAWRDDRVARVTVAGTIVTPESVVFAAGAWTPAVSGRSLPIAPVGGQMLALRAQPPPCRHVLFHAGGSVTPQRRGELWVGGTIDAAGFATAVTLAGLAELHADLIRMLPGAADLPVARVWYGIRPGAPDGGPIIGLVGRNAVVASGHHRNGILLAPITAELVRSLLDGTSAPVAPEPFAPR